jgi:hypothetical protein
VPSHPPRDGYRNRTFELPEEHIRHLDRQAAANGWTRAECLRRIIAADIRRVHGKA